MGGIWTPLTIHTSHHLPLKFATSDFWVLGPVALLKSIWWEYNSDEAKRLPLALWLRLIFLGGNPGGVLTTLSPPRNKPSTKEWLKLPLWLSPDPLIKWALCIVLPEGLNLALWLRYWPFRGKFPPRFIGNVLIRDRGLLKGLFPKFEDICICSRIDRLPESENLEAGIVWESVLRFIVVPLSEKSLSADTVSLSTPFSTCRRLLLLFKSTNINKNQWC